MKKPRPTEITLPVYNVAATLHVRAGQGRLELSLRSGEHTAALGLVDVSVGRVVLRDNILHPDVRRRVLVSIADGLDALAFEYDDAGEVIEHKDGRPKLSQIAPLVRPLARQARGRLQSV